MTPAEREKKIADVISSVAYMQGWARHPEHGWFCPFGCHITIYARALLARKGENGE